MISAVDWKLQRELEERANKLLNSATPKTKAKKKGKPRDRTLGELGIVSPGESPRVGDSTAVHRKHRSFRKR
jgi:hypothetical protein